MPIGPVIPPFFATPCPRGLVGDPTLPFCSLARAPSADQQTGPERPEFKTMMPALPRRGLAGTPLTK